MYTTFIVLSETMHSFVVIHSNRRDFPAILLAFEHNMAQNMPIDVTL
jgi:hypothetical protein